MPGEKQDAVTAFRFRPPEWLAAVDSTNTYLRQTDHPSGWVTAARIQTAGRGRLGNSWFSRPGTGLTFSFVWRGVVPYAEAVTLPLVCGLGLADCLAGLGLEPRCKWPNDILLADAKMAGILCESMAVEAGELRFVVGIGLNLKPDPERERASGRVVADLESASGKAWDPEDLLSLVLPALEVRINTWLSQGFGVLHPDYLAVLWGRGGETVVRTGREVLQGRLEGVGKDGRLWLRLATGEKKEIASAVSVEAVAPGHEPV